jgi:uncharacterized protein YyaL (SSP411 family)
MTANHLVQETSPYLLQHAHNPVDWYPWNEEALQRAHSEDKPIFLSIGYSACHWCHVMAHESFEDEHIAEILNQHFVSVKVDREERPDLDRIYMAAVQAMTGQGGWPMSVFLTPEGKPFYAGTYFPPQPRYGMPSFADVLRAIVAAWRDRRPEVIQSGNQVFDAVRQSIQGQIDPQASPPTEDTLHRTVAAIQAEFDRKHGGWGGAPKFPQPMVIEFLLRRYHSTQESEALDMVTGTLEAMARGGMYDQIGGGFHRYSVDDHWLVPHFEKMLYDNAQLSRVYLHAWQVTGTPLFRAIAEEVLDYVAREMVDPSGGFYSSQDADSEGQEGKFYLWTPEEVRDILDGQAAEFAAAYGISAGGNLDGQNVLSLVGSLEQRDAMARARRQLWQARERRVHPGRDDKVLTAWNGLMLAAFGEAARVLQRPDYAQIAERNADLLLRELRTPHGHLLRTWKAGQAKLNAYLEDYAYLIDGLLELYQTTFDARWFMAALELANTMIEHFAAPQGFYDTSDDHEQLVGRSQDIQDNAVPSGNAMATWVLLRLADLTFDMRYSDLAERTLASVVRWMEQYPLGFAQWLTAADYALAKRQEIAIIGDPASPDALAMLVQCRQDYQPHRTVAMGAPVDGNEAPSPVPLLQGRPQLEGRATTYVCRGSTCLPPVTSLADLKRLLATPTQEVMRLLGQPTTR